MLLIGYKQVHSCVQWVQSCNMSASLKKVGMLSKFCLSWLSVMFFHVHYKQAMTCFLLKLGEISTFSKSANCIRPKGFCNFVVFAKIYSCLFSPNCTQNHVITHTKRLRETIAARKAERFNTFTLWSEW